MKEAQSVSIEHAMFRDAGFDTIIDVRSPSEFALDHLPGAINLPVLDNQEREVVGTVNARESAFAAKRLGAAKVAARISEILSGPLAGKPHQWKPLIYCWRGGNRSGSLATVMARIGWQTSVLTGGYKAYRRWVINKIDDQAPAINFHVIAGRTGSGKSRILQKISDTGAQVLDLEALANHRGSVLGLLPDQQQPSQKLFESRIAQALDKLDAAQPVYVESESRKIGQVQIPNSLITTMRQAPCIVMDFPVEVRAQFLITDYAHFLTQPAQLLGQLSRLTEMHGREKIESWARLSEAQQWPELVESLLTDHYDPAYDRSMHKNYKRLGQARTVGWNPDSTGFDQVFQQLAEQIIRL